MLSEVVTRRPTMRREARRAPPASVFAGDSGPACLVVTSRPALLRRFVCIAASTRPTEPTQRRRRSSMEARASRAVYHRAKSRTWLTRCEGCFGQRAGLSLTEQHCTSCEVLLRRKRRRVNSVNVAGRKQNGSSAAAPELRGHWERRYMHGVKRGSARRVACAEHASLDCVLESADGLQLHWRASALSRGLRPRSEREKIFFGAEAEQARL